MIIHILEHSGLSEEFIERANKYKGVELIFGPLKANLFSQVIGIYTELSHVLDEVFLSKYTSIKFIATPTTSLTHIDRGYCLERNISILSLKDKQDLISNFTSTPEIAWWHLIELNRNCSKAQDAVTNGTWNRKIFFGSSFSNTNFGVIGFGRIGSRMAKIAENFNMRVFAFDTSPRVNSSNYPSVNFLNSIEEIFKLCNFISIHVDDHKSNLNLINQKQFDQIKNKGTILVNTSRGFILNSNDAIKALKTGMLGGLGIDVLPEEDNADFQKVWKRNPIVKAKVESNLNISITPHIGGATVDSLKSAAEAVFEELCEIGAGNL